MTLGGWLKDCGLMTMRTKPQYLSALGRKRSSLTSPQKLSMEKEGGFCSIWGPMCCSVSCGILLLLLKEGKEATAGHMFVPLIIAAIISLCGGLCLSEYINLQPQETPSVYSCCYQYSSEILAFFMGWLWLLSQAAMVGSMCSSASTYINACTHFQQNFNVPHAEVVISCTVLTIVFLILVTGINRTTLWHVLVMPTVLFLILLPLAIKRASQEEFNLFSGDWMDVQSVTDVLTSSSLCLLFFTGPQNLPRMTSRETRYTTSATLGPMNSMSFVVVLLLLVTSSGHEPIVNLSSTNHLVMDVTSDVFVGMSFLLLIIELFHPLHLVVESMALDGLLFRGLSKKWTPFCCSVASPCVQILSVVAVGVLVAFHTREELLVLAVIFPLFVHTIVPILVLIRRYRDITSWQYEPMRQTAARRESSRKHESQYSNGLGLDQNLKEKSTTCVASSDDSSDTDIDSMVQQYRDQALIANMSVHDEHDPGAQVPEPTPSSWFHAKLCLGALMLTSFVSGSALLFEDLDCGPAPVIVALSCALLSTILQGVLILLPQNTHQGVCCPKCPALPWLPGMASLAASTLLMHCGKPMWKVLTGWTVLGFFIYFVYGIHSSTAANSFHNLKTTHIALRPLPSYGNNCITQIIPSQRKRKATKMNSNSSA